MKGVVWLPALKCSICVREEAWPSRRQSWYLGAGAGLLSSLGLFEDNTDVVLGFPKTVRQGWSALGLLPQVWLLLVPPWGHKDSNFLLGQLTVWLQVGLWALPIGTSGKSAPWLLCTACKGR